MVTRKFCQKQLPFLRRVGRDTLSRALHDAGLQWINRRAKAAVPEMHKAARAYKEGMHAHIVRGGEILYKILN